MVDEIARKLANKSCYKLCFEPFIEIEEEIITNDVKNIKNVNISFGINSNTWDLDANERAKILKNIFKEAKRDNVYITKSNYYGSFVINFKE